MAVDPRLNNPELCICCSRRSDGLAVGKPGRLAWFCSECGPDLAKIALAMIERRKFDAIEERAAKAVGELCGTSITLPQEEIAQFVQWAVTEFGRELTKELESGGPPF